MSLVLVLAVGFCLLLGIAVIAFLLLGKGRGASAARSDDELQAQLQRVALEIKTDVAESNLTALGQVSQQLTLLCGEQFGSATSAVEAEFDKRKSLIDAQLQSVNSSLGQVNKAIVDLAQSSNKNYGTVASQLAATSASTSELAHATRSIHQMLNHTTARGQHGEYSAEGVLQAAGLVKGIHYETQSSNDAGTRPDFTVKIGPENSLSVDSKFPMNNLWRSAEAENEAERKTYEAAFIRDARDRVNELTSRDYVQANTVDLVVMFVASEAVFSYILEHDPGIYEHAMRQKIVITGPFGLFALLSTIKQGANNLVVAKRSQEILALMRTFTIQWEKFAAGLELLGKKLQQVDKTYDALTSTRRSQLDRVLARIDSLPDSDEEMALASPDGAKSMDGDYSDDTDNDEMVPLVS